MLNLSPAASDLRQTDADPRFGECRICGTSDILTYEHVPPKRAFNDQSILISTGQDLFNGDPRKARRRQRRKGAGGYTLCGRCNSYTGGHYGAAYVDWAHQGMLYREGGFYMLALPYHIFPLRVAKQIVSMFASTCPAGLVSKNTSLQKFLLDRDTIGLPREYRLYCYIIDKQSSGSRTTGIVGQMSNGRHYRYAEIGFVPFGYLMTIDSDPPDAGLMDITFFAHHRWNDWRSLHAKLPARSVNTHFPADFRSLDEWHKALERDDEA